MRIDNAVLPSAESSIGRDLPPPTSSIADAFNTLLNEGIINSQQYAGLSSQFETILATQDPEAVTAASEQLSQIISSFTTSQGETNTSRTPVPVYTGIETQDSVAIPGTDAQSLEAILSALTSQMSGSVGNFGDGVIQGAFTSAEEAAAEKEKEERSKPSFA